ncbi:MAG: DNA cytosine methyltransferase [Eubacteriales bacterium]
MLLQDIIGGLEEIGYEVQTFVIPACGVGAWHKRYRIAIVANSGGAGQQGEEQPGTCSEWEPYESAREFRDLRNTESGNLARNNGRRKRTRSEKRRWRPAQPGLGRVADGIPDWVDGYWDAEPEGIPRVTSGIPNRAERLKALGNAVVPQQFYPIFKAIADVECQYQG